MKSKRKIYSRLIWTRKTGKVEEEMDEEDDLEDEDNSDEDEEDTNK
jgi:hypothetical protein